MTSRPTSLSVAARLATMLFSALFAVAFGGGGLYFGLMPLARTVHSAWEVRSWQAVPAEVLSSELVSQRSSDATTHQVLARYRYTFGGRAHEATRVGLDPTPGSDNIGKWHQQWHARLSRARERGQAVTAWVDPAEPGRALLDPDIRWEMAIFRLPFALVFSGVGLGALWVFWRALWGSGPAWGGAGGGRGAGSAGVAAQADASSMPSSAGRGQGLLWIFALFWCGIAFPMAALMWMSATPWWPRAFVSIFVVVGVVLLAMAWRQSVLAWRFAGTRVRYVPGAPPAGSDFEVELSLPARALRSTLPVGRRLRIAQYRVDDSGSGTQERRVEAFELTPSVVPDLANGERWHARFELPADAPAHGGRRSGERVDWRLEILKADGAVEVSYDVPVQAQHEAAVRHQATEADRHDRRPAWGREQAIAPGIDRETLGDAPLPLPDRVQVVEGPDGWEIRCLQSGWRWAAALALLPLGLLCALWWKAAPRAGWSDALGSVQWWGAALLLLFVLHAGTRQWRLRLHDDALEREVASWVWHRSQVLALASLERLFSKLLYTQTSGQLTTAFHALHARETANGPAVRLTPGLPGEGAVVAVAQALQVANAHRAGRFTPGGVRERAAKPWRLLAGWLVWALLVMLLAMGPMMVPWPR